VEGALRSGRGGNTVRKDRGAAVPTAGVDDAVSAGVEEDPDAWSAVDWGVEAGVVAGAVVVDGAADLGGAAGVEGAPGLEAVETPGTLDAGVAVVAEAEREVCPEACGTDSTDVEGAVPAEFVLEVDTGADVDGDGDAF
jgi:hypothetical protein